MRRWLLLLTAALMASVAAMFSLFNRDSVKLDLIFSQFDLPLGVLVIAAVFVGAALAGMVLFSTLILAQNLKLRALRRELDRLKSAQAAPKPPVSPPTPMV